ncbi:hypothetical protein E2V02_20400 [Salmonella enterica]|nr:hypothetical protein [Salmonella enterica]EAW2133989.1 hypothetical protein [Salmonella enterica subsp. enterica]EBI0041406.1 hypothetical protein [Salmonella enterica subsp. diarizonae serovar 61:k:z35]EAM6612702.1 hypothetical protein [Salmonella enterica]EAM6904366.1 hypothetical protein [Salmonella enterica]
MQKKAQQVIFQTTLEPKAYFRLVFKQKRARQGPFYLNLWLTALPQYDHHWLQGESLCQEPVHQTEFAAPVGFRSAVE